jgi:hypothetical protein
MRHLIPGGGSCVEFCVRVGSGVVALLLVVLGGCAGRPVKPAVCPPPEIYRPGANLALGPSPQYVRVASGLTGRREWPAVSVGYVLDDITFLSDVQFDDQYFYDRLGGYSRLGQTIRTAVTLR